MTNIYHIWDEWIEKEGAMWHHANVAKRSICMSTLIQDAITEYGPEAVYMRASQETGR